MSFPFSQTHIPYSYIYADGFDHEVNGVFILYHAKKVGDREDIVPLCFGYGNLAIELKRIERQLLFLLQEPLFYDFIAEPKEPQKILEEFKLKYKPILRVAS